MTCERCGRMSSGLLLCDKCTEEILEEASARRRRMSITFTVIVILGIVAYYYLI